MEVGVKGVVCLCEVSDVCYHELISGSARPSLSEEPSVMVIRHGSHRGLGKTGAERIKSKTESAQVIVK